MPTYERRTRIDASLDDVWDFHSQISGLETLTPSWLRLRVESVVGPGGERHPDVLEEGSEVTLSMRPFGVGPRTAWTSRIVERERGDDAAYFRDEMVDGPFDRWLHTHAFYADDGATIVRDRVEYALPGGVLGDVLGPFARIGFEPMFRQRHRATKDALERSADASRPSRAGD